MVLPCPSRSDVIYVWPKRNHVHVYSTFTEDEVRGFDAIKLAWANSLVGEGSNLESQQIMRELESHNTSSSEPLDVLKARARELVTTSMIGSLGWAVTEARTNNRLPVEATDHLAYLFQLGKLPDLTCLFNVIFDVGYKMQKKKFKASQLIRKVHVKLPLCVQARPTVGKK